MLFICINLLLLCEYDKTHKTFKIFIWVIIESHITVTLFLELYNGVHIEYNAVIFKYFNSKSCPFHFIKFTWEVRKTKWNCSDWRQWSCFSSTHSCLLPLTLSFSSNENLELCKHDFQLEFKIFSQLKHKIELWNVMFSFRLASYQVETPVAWHKAQTDS